MAVARSRKWLITINNPAEHGFDHARIRAAVLDLPGILYWCLCDEQGDECETLHTHVFFVCQNQLTHTQVDARFPSFHRDIAYGKSIAVSIGLTVSASKPCITLAIPVTS